MPVHRVVALVREVKDQARLRGALRGSGELLACQSPYEVLAALAEKPAVAVVVSAYGPDVADAIALTRVLQARHPSSPVLIYYDPQHTNPRDLLEFFQAGAADIVPSRGDDLHRVFASVLAAAGHRAKGRAMLDQLEPVLPPQALRLVRYILEKADTPLSIEEAASAVGIARRTLEKRLAKLGYPPPETLIGWCRLLLAAHLLEDQARTFDEVALQLSFPSGMALRSMMKRYTGFTGREARDGGPVALVLRQLTEQLNTPQASAEIKKSRAKTRAKSRAVSPKR
jgi:AraC-like DNA-binding protein